MSNTLKIYHPLSSETRFFALPDDVDVISAEGTEYYNPITGRGRTEISVHAVKRLPLNNIEVTLLACTEPECCMAPRLFEAQPVGAVSKDGVIPISEKIEDAVAEKLGDITQLVAADIAEEIGARAVTIKGSIDLNIKPENILVTWD